MTFINELIIKMLDSLKVKSPVFYFWFMTSLVALNGAAIYVQEIRPDLISPATASVMALLSIIIASATGTRTTQKIEQIESKKEDK